MELKAILNEYELDWATFVARQKEYPVEQLKNKSVFVAGGQDYFARSVIYFLFALNDLRQLNIKISLVSEDSRVLSVLFPKLLKREDFKFFTTDMLNTKPVTEPVDYFIYTGCCNKMLEGTPAFFMDEVSKEKRMLTIAQKIEAEHFILLSDYRSYGSVKQGMCISEYENGQVDFSSVRGFESQLMKTLESLPPIYAKQYGFSYTILRTGIALGASAMFDDSLFTDLFAAVAKGERVSILNSKKRYSFVYISDILKALFFSMTTMRKNTVYNVVGKDCTLSTGMLVAKIHDKYPQEAKVILEDSEKDPGYGVEMNNQKIICSGCEPVVTMSCIIELLVQYNKKDKDIFLFKDLYQGKLQEIQSILLGYLLEVDRICKKHGIRYFLAGGTLLGAIRHNGFIPWDDDADVMMLREDYEKFLSVVESELPVNISLHTPRTDKLNHCVFTKLRINNTMFATKFTSQFLDMHNGIFFDVLSHDQTANSKIGRKIHLQLTILTRSLVFNKWHKRKINNGNKYTSAIANVLKVILPMRFLEWCQNKCIRWFEHKKDAKYLYDGMGRNVYKGDFPKAWLEEIIYWEFEGQRFPIPKEYDQYLRYLYGDYTEMVPLCDRQISHSIELMDLGEYSNYKVKAKKTKTVSGSPPKKE